jgi:hypothetical protein
MRRFFLPQRTQSHFNKIGIKFSRLSDLCAFFARFAVKKMTHYMKK